MDDKVTTSSFLQAGASGRDTRPQLPLQCFLAECYEQYRGLTDGVIADYIPELARVAPDQFGIAVTTVDGFTHVIGDSQTEFTIQSVSKAFVFALALELCGPERVSETIGVEPSGEAFNSIRLGPDNRPFNPMVNAGAIACSGLIYDVAPAESFDRIQDMLDGFAGRHLQVDEAVYQSERATGDRNRAIAWLLKNNARLSESVDAILDLYFKQCALLVTAADISVMGATLANSGVNPVTQKVVVSPETCARVLSVMASSGMYDYSGEWLYRIGLPAKSGVGGGIVAVLPAQLGLGTFSPRLDRLGNSVRGLKVCEHVSSFFSLHLLNSQADVQSSVAAHYDLTEIQSRKDRQPVDRAILEQHGKEARVIELAGALNFVSADYVSRRLCDTGDHGFQIFDFRRVANISAAAARLFVKLFANMEATGKRIVVSGLTPGSLTSATLEEELAVGGECNVRLLPSLNEAVTWVEDQIIYLYGGFESIETDAGLECQDLLAGLSEDELRILREETELIELPPGRKIIRSGDPADSIYFLLKGMVSVKLANGARVAILEGGTCFGELALAWPHGARSADIETDTSARCLRLSLESFERLRQDDRAITDRIMRNMVCLTADRLIKANRKMEILLR